MALYVFEARNSSGMVTGLTPTVTTYKQVSDGANVTPPTIAEIGGGGYRMSATPTVKMFGIIDFGASLTSADDRYRSFVIDPEDENVTITTSPTGARQVTITVLDNADDATPIPDVDVKVLNSDQSLSVNNGQTDPDGKVILALDDATYNVRLQKAGWNFTTPESMVVSATGLSFSFLGDAITTGGVGSVQHITGVITKLDGTSADGDTIVATVNGLGQDVDGQYISSQKLTDTVSGSMFELDIVQGADVTVYAKDTRGSVYKTWSFTVDSDSSKDIKAYDA